MYRLWISCSIFWLDYFKFLPNSVVEVCFHVLKDQVQVLVVLGLKNLVHLHDVGVVQLVQENYLAVGSLGIC